MTAKRFWLPVLFVLLTGAWSSASAEDAYIKLEIDSDEIYAGDIVRLNIESTNLPEPIDISPIEAQATLLRETTGTRIAVFSGKVVEIAIRHMDLQPKRSGLLVFGPLKAGDVESGSVFVNVLNQSRPQWQPRPDDLQIRTSVTPASPYLHQQAILHIELLHRYPVSSESITLPDLSGFASRPIYKARRTFTGKSREWSHTEWRYLIYPSRSGKLKLDDVRWSGTTIRSNTERAEYDRQHEISPINVQAAGNTDSSWWLPARNLTLAEAWQPAATSLRAGDEVRRIITVTADGVLAGQIPEPQVPASRAIRQTLIQTDRSETIVNESVQSVATFTYRVKAESPIPVFLDTIRMGWWNTTDNTAAEAIVPARRINVGLPDRADVLSELARVETGTGKLQHWIQSNGTARSLIVTSGALAFLILCWQGVTPTRRTIQHYRERSVRRQQLTPLKDLNDPAALYRYLQRPCNRHILETEDCRLLQEIEQGLFSDKGEPLSSAQYREWINRADVALSKTRSLQSSAAHSPLGLL